MPNALLVYPEFPPSYWSEKYVLRFIRKKAALPPLGLLSVAALFPENYELRLIDMNVRPLKTEDLEWSDAVFLSGMVVQRQSFEKVVRLCNQYQKPVVAGGPYPTSSWEEIEGIDHFVLGEAELTFSHFLRDFQGGKAGKTYGAPCLPDGSPERPDLSSFMLLPRYDLINIKDYASLSIQFSRGCPFDCEFCDITKLYGRRPRTKDKDQMLEELQLLYDCGWRGSVFFVDDNFIGNRSKVRELLPCIAEWQKARNHPFNFYTEASVNLSEMPELMKSMADAGFNMVFLGIETPNPKALTASRKLHNLKKGNASYLQQAVRRIQEYGMEVCGGFILGLDGDDASCFRSQFDFIQKTGIATAMVGLLSVLKGTDLYARLKEEGRLLRESSGDNVSINLNFIPEMNSAALIAGYKNLLSRLYDRGLRNYFERCFVLIKHWQRRTYSGRKFRWREIFTLFRSLRLQLLSWQGPAYFKFLTKVLRHRPRMFPEAVRLAIMGYHYEMVTRQQILLHDFKQFLQSERASLQRTIEELSSAGSEQLTEVQRCLKLRFSRVRRRYRKINKDFRFAADEALQAFQESIETRLAELGHLDHLKMPVLLRR